MTNGATDDLVLITGLMQQILGRLEPLDGVDRIASQDEVTKLADALSGMQITLSEQQIKALHDTAKAGAKEGGSGAGSNQLYQIRTLLDEGRNEQAKFLHRVDSAAAHSSAQTALIARWKWWALGGVGIAGALLGGLLVALVVIRGEALDFRDNIRHALLFDGSCELASGQLGQNLEGATYCAFWKPE